MSNKKQINEKELEKVTGGRYGLEDPKYPTFSGYLNMYSLKENEEYYFVTMNYEKDFWFRGILLKSFEQEGCLDTSRRTHEIKITHTGNFINNKKIGDIIQVNGDKTAVYKNRG